MPLTLTTISATPQPSRGRMLCPDCGCTHVVLVALDAISPLKLRGALSVAAQRVHLDPTVPAIEGGSAVALTFRCHHGHQFMVRFLQLHDSTFAEVGLLPRGLAVPDPKRN